MFVLAAKELADIAERRGLHSDAERTGRTRGKWMRPSGEQGWDGDWFVRAYDDSGQKVGSKECEEGKIFIEPQGFCIIAGIGLEDGLARRALDSVNAMLATKHGIMLQQPAYSKYYLHLGEISSYPPGYKENAGIFCHNNPWIIIAETLVGNGDRALDYYVRINPSAREKISDLHRCEPYVYAQMIAGKDAPDAWGGEELMADRDGGLELCGRHTIHPRHSSDLRRAFRRTGHPGVVERVHGLTGVPRRAI